jgi:hypothetical protein
MSWLGVANSGEVLFTTGDNGLVDYGGLAGDVTGVRDATVVGAIQGTAVSAVAPTTSGEILEYNGSEWTVVPAAAGQTHVLLDGSTVTDSAAYTVARGSLVVGNATPAWDGLALGTAEFVLYSDGTDALYTRIGTATPLDDGVVVSGVVTPSLTFDGDRTTGAYLPSSGSLGLAANSVELITLDGINTQVTLDAGQVVQTAIGGTTTLGDADYVYFANAGSTTITLPAAPTAGQVFYIKDSGGNASGATPITVAGNGNNIDGNATIVIRRQYGSFTVIYNGTEWNII